MSSYISLFVLLALGVSAAPTSSVSTSITSQETCITRFRPGPPAASLSTSTRTSTQTDTDTVTVTAAGAGTETQTITPSPITSTIGFTISGAASLPKVANSTTTTLTVTAPAGTGNGACSSTKTVSAAATTTVYTGSYNGTVAKRTAAAYDSLFEKRQNPFAGMMSHSYGQPGDFPYREAFEVDCLLWTTTYLVATSTVSAPLQTTTVTANASTVYITRTLSATGSAITAAPAPITITSTVTQQAAGNGTSAGLCTVTQGKASATTTQHIKCAPTNMISVVNGYGIGATQGHANETEGLANGSDPSACCQTCVDTEGCAASSDDQSAGNCFLYYTTPSCGLGFDYTDGGKKLAAGSGFLVQTGCGTVEVGASTD